MTEAHYEEMAEAVDEMIALLQNAERPAILVGGGAWFSDAGAELLEFAERANTPVFSNAKAHGLVGASHPLCGGGFANLGIAAGAGLEADLVVVLGARLGMFTGGRGARLIPVASKLIQVDIAAEEIGRNREADLAIVADCREALRLLNSAASEGQWSSRDPWLELIRNVRDGQRVVFAEALSRDIEESHCNLLPRAMVGPMTQVQRYRDAMLAGALLKAGERKGAILITGNGHARTDRGVPWYLTRQAGAATSSTVMLLEIADDAKTVEDLAMTDPDGKPAADYLWITPRAEREDQCEKLRLRFGK